MALNILNNIKYIINKYTFFRIWKHISLKRKFQFIGLLLVTVLASFSEVLSIGALIPFLGVLSNPDMDIPKPFQFFSEVMPPINNTDKLWIFTSLFCFTACFSAVIRIILIWLQTKITFDCGADLGEKIYGKVLSQPYFMHIARSSSEVIATITSKTNAIVHSGLYPFAVIISTIFIAGSVIALLIFISPAISLFSIAGFGILYLALAFSSKNILSKDSIAISELTTRQIKLLQEGLGGVRDVLLTGTQLIYVDSYARSDRKLKNALARQLIVSSSPRYILEGVVLVGIAYFAYITIQNNYNSDESLIPILGIVAFSAQRLLPLMQQGYSSWAAIASGSQSIFDALEILDDKNIYSLSIDEATILFRKEIICKNISFSHRSEKKIILENINLVIEKGDSIGITGKTGCGKSTLLDVMMGLLVPTDGDLLVDGEPISKNNASAWQKNIAHVPQNIFLADLTIAENIAFGIHKSKIDYSVLQEAIKLSQLEETIAELPLGINTTVGERGVRLSGGQQQRLGIARALYRKKEIIFMDEATSALDVETEKKIIFAIENIQPKLTLIMIAHRTSTLLNCKKVFIIDKGKLLEDGEF